MLWQDAMKAAIVDQRLYVFTATKDKAGIVKCDCWYDECRYEFVTSMSGHYEWHEMVPIYFLGYDGDIWGICGFLKHECYAKNICKV